MAGAVALLRACGALSSAPAAHNKGAAGDYVVFLRTTLGAAVPLEVGCEGTVADLERAAEAAAGIRCSGAWPASQLAAVPAVYGWPSDTLSFQGKVLADRSANLSDCGIGPESVVEVVSLGEVAPDLPRNYSRRLIVELQRRLQEDPPPGVRWYVKDRPAMEWVMQLKKGSDSFPHQAFTAEVDGVEDSIYAGWTFLLDVWLPPEYPFGVPRMRFQHPVYHPQVEAAAGEICLDVLRDKWSPALTVDKLLISIRHCITGGDEQWNPPSDDWDVLNADAKRLWESDRAAAVRTAKEWAARHARPARAG
eukprot:TRINITY_DN15394_c0_g1_i1.p1 TRINITY_DN15394_c0_g1~~TRINITY_DN15394_c0_g1_i1.p1  ORF type:complete len:343 (+),score=90.65 TRINITY_DN15394_c0_g1_i1:110-1030(+)